MNAQALMGIIAENSLRIGHCDTGMTPSTTSIECADFAGFGDDFFNGTHWMKIIRNANATGTAPEGEIRKISDYTDAGVFTVDAFTGNVEEGDVVCVILGTLLPAFKKGVGCVITFPIYDSDGDPVVGATGLDSEVSIDGGTFDNCTNEAIQIASNSGVYKLELTGTEMAGDVITIITKTSTTGAKTAVTTIYTVS